MKYLPSCRLSVIFSSACMGTIWQIPLIVHPGTWRQILLPSNSFSLDQKATVQPVFPHCDSAIQQLNNFVLPWTFFSSFSFLFSCGDQESKPSLEGGFLTGTVIPLSPGSAPINSILDTLWLIPFVVHCGPVGFYYLSVYLQVIDRLVSVGFLYFGYSLISFA